MKRTSLLCTTVAVVMVIGGCSRSDRTAATNTATSKQPAEHSTAVGTGGAAANVKSDDEFVRDVALMNMTQIELGRVALGKSVSSDIRFFAQRMIDEHDAAGSTLKSLASDRNDWPAQLDDKHRKIADDLAKKQGPDFDRDYAKAVVDSQQNLAAMLESRLDVQSVADWKTAAAGRAQGKALPDPKTEMADVKVRPIRSDNELTMKINQWAADTYPVVQKHIDMARALANAKQS